MVVDRVDQQHRGRRRHGDVPAALGHWHLLGPPGDQRLPVHRLHVDLEAAALQQCLRHRREVGQHGEVGRLQQHDRRAVIAGLLQDLLRLIEARFEDPFGAGRILERGAAAEHGLADLVVARIADDGLQEVLLVERDHGGTAVADVVERRLFPVESQDVGRAKLVGNDDLDVLVLLDDRQQVVRGLLDHVDLALLQGVDRGLRVGDRDPFDPIDLGHLAAGQARGRLGARLVVGIAEIDDLLAGLPFVLLEDERPRARRVGNLLGDRSLGDPLGHDEGRNGGRLGQRLQHHAIGLLQDDLEGPVVERLHFLGLLAQQAAQRILGGEAPDRRQNVRRRHRLAVMPLQALAQLEGPGELVVAHRPALDHLRPRLELGIEREQRVVDEIAVIADDVGGCPDRIDDLEIRLHDDFQRLAGLGLGRRCGEQRDGGEQGTTQHEGLPQLMAGGVQLVSSSSG